jgi:hypothetical protein
VAKLVGVLFLLGMASCGGCLVAGYRAEPEGRAAAQEILPKISQPWNVTSVKAIATGDLLSTQAPGSLEKFLVMLQTRVGSLKQIKDLKNQGWNSFLGTQGFILTSVYVADCEFEHGSGRVTLVLVRRDGFWKLSGLNVNSDALLQ